jgi:excisionase family DNA binding protein
MNGLVSLEEAASLLACSPAMLRKWIAKARIPIVKVGRLTRIRRDDLEAWTRVGLRKS